MESSPNPDGSKEALISSLAFSTFSQNRLSLPFIIRVTVATSGGFFTGMVLGLALGSKAAALRYRAENAHRLPTSSTGWYLYHKSKNYNVMLGGLKEGFKGGSKIAFWSAGFFMVEEAVDRLRGKEDFVSTCVAGLGIAGGFSAWNRFPLMTAARTAKIGLYGGLAFGLAQDAMSLVRGRPVGYVDFLFGTKRQEDDTENRVI